MAQELIDGKITGSSGIAKAGLTLGIIGTGLAALSGNGLFNGGLFGGNTTEKIANMQSEIDKLEANRYSDALNFEMYKTVVANSDITNARINAVQAQLYDAVLELDKRSALTEQASRLNREYDNTVRDYMMTIVNNKIDYCCDKMNMKVDYENQISELSDAAILSYVNSNFIPGRLSLPASSITPTVQLK